MKRQKIVDGDWDYLIILDACRYDYFKELYKNYSNLKKGKLEKRKSRGSNTFEWLENTFQEPIEDAVYISANPYINSQGLSLKESTGDPCFKLNPTEIFKNVIDAWDILWDEEIGAVPPGELTNLAKRYKSENKMIIHYIQPHRPYLTASWDYTFQDTNEKVKGNKQRKNEIKLVKVLKRVIKRFFYNRLSKVGKWKLRSFFGLKIKSNWYKLYKEGKEDQLRHYYRKNVELVLKEIDKLVEDLEGRIIITADHGEAFGEQGEWDITQDLKTLY